MERERILVIVKDDNLASQLVTALRTVGYYVWRARDGVEGLKKLRRASPDLVVIERELSPVNKQDPLSRIRQASYVPIIAVGKDNDPTDVLEFGADVYMLNPPSLMELTARVRALLRRKNLGRVTPGQDELGERTDALMIEPRVSIGKRRERKE